MAMMHTTPDRFDDSIAGQVALVTGGGRGLGRVFAQALAAAGATVAVLARSADQVEETAAHIKATGGRAIALVVDVTDQQGVEGAVATVRRRLGPVDLLVNNAGIGGPMGPAWEVSTQDWWRAMEINVLGSYLCASAVLPAMVARGRGRIINLASHAGVFRWPLASAYSVSKAAVVKFTENLARETRRHGLAVFAMHPGIARIGLTEQALSPDAASDGPAAWLRQEVAAGRVVAPERAAELVLYLASGRADALSGRYLTVHDDIPALVARAEEIERDDAYVLRVRLLR